MQKLRKGIDISIVICTILSIIWLFWFDDLSQNKEIKINKFIFYSSNIDETKSIEFKCSEEVPTIMTFLYYSKEYIAYILLLIFFYPYSKIKNFLLFSIFLSISMFGFSTILLLFDIRNYNIGINDPFTGYITILTTLVLTIVFKKLFKI